MNAAARLRPDPERAFAARVLSDAVAPVVRPPAGEAATADQEALGSLLVCLSLDPRVPVDAVAKLAEVVRLANAIGQGNPS
jgi:hypothetical protein